MKYSDPSGEFAMGLLPFLGALAAVATSPAAAVVGVGLLVVGGAIAVGTMINNSDKSKTAPASVAVSTTITKSDDRVDIYYRGLSNADMNDIETTGSIKSNALREGSNITREDIDDSAMRRHAGSSEGSAFVSVTRSRSVAEDFATDGPEASGMVAIIGTNRAVANKFSPFREEQESLIMGMVMPHEILAVVPATSIQE